MASDSLNQIGKYINKTGKNADRALKRARPIQPRLERVRDVFDPTSDFEMSFKRLENDERVMLDLFFSLPPPIRGCKAGCIITKCEEFDFPSGGNHYVTLLHPYLVGSVSIYINGDKVLGTDMSETSSISGEVFYQSSSSGPDTVAICYIYRDDSEECNSQSHSLLCAYGLKPSFVGGQLVFSDRFDADTTIDTWGGSGNWLAPFPSNASTAVTIYDPINSRGSLTLDFFPRYYIFENYQAAGITQEVILAVDMTNAVEPNRLFYAPYDGPSLTLFVSGSGEITNSYIFFNSDANAWASGILFQPFTLNFDPRQKIFIRLFASINGWFRVKIWPMNEAEPAEWIDWALPLPTSIPNATILEGSLEWTKYITIGGHINGFGPKLLGIEHWVGQVSDVYGDTGGEFLPIQENLNGVPDGNAGYSWSKVVNQEPKFDFSGGFYFQLGSFPDSFGEFNSGGNSNINNNFPSHSYSNTSNFFGDPNPMIPTGTVQQVKSFDIRYGKPSIVKIIGQVRWAQHNGFTFGKIPALTVYLEAHSYGADTPLVEGEVMVGGDSNNSITVQIPNDPTTTDTAGPFPAGISYSNKGVWTDFELTVPTVDAAHVQWGTRFQETPQQVAALMGEYGDNGSILRTNDINIEFRYIRTEMVFPPGTSATPLCPDTGIIADRCSQINNNFNEGQTLEYDCYGVGPAEFISNGIPWRVFPQSSMPTIELNDSLNITFRAHGITEDGSDGRCPADYGYYNGDVSYTSSSFFLEASKAPGYCGEEVTLGAQFRIGDIGRPWYVTSFAPNWDDNQGDPLQPTLEMRFIVGNRGLRFFIRSDENSLLFENELVPFTIEPHVTYDTYMEFVNGQSRLKIWKSEDAEPSDWTYIVAQPAFGGVWAPSFDISYDGFIVDDFYIQFFNVTSTSIQAAI